MNVSSQNVFVSVNWIKKKSDHKKKWFAYKVKKVHIAVNFFAVHLEVN